MKKKLKNKFRNFVLDVPLLNPYGFTVDRMIRNITFWTRLLPDVIIVGNNKSASNTVFYNLIEHPLIGEVQIGIDPIFQQNHQRKNLKRIIQKC